MSGAFFDTNVLIYTIEDDPVRRTRAATLLAEGGAISVQCLNEFAAVARRKLGLDWRTVQAARDQLLALCSQVLPVSVEIHIRGLEVAERYKLSLWDGMIVSAALSIGCATLYSEDMQHGLVIDGRLTVVNPFLG